MSPEHHAKVPPDRRAMLSVPIRSDADDVEDRRLPVVGTLSIDTTTPLDNTSWRSGDDVRAEVVIRLMTWENVVRRLLKKRHP